MVKDAELNAADDKKKLELVQARNAGRSQGPQRQEEPGASTATSLKPAKKTKIEAAVKELEEVSERRRQRSH